jgi:protease I
MSGQLSGILVAILATDGFEQSELLEPRRALNQEGAATQAISLKNGDIKGWNHKEWANRWPSMKQWIQPMQRTLMHHYYPAG